MMTILLVFSALRTAAEMWFVKHSVECKLSLLEQNMHKISVTSYPPLSS